MSEQFVYGIHAVSALLSKARRPTKKLYLNENREDKSFQAIIALAEAAKIPIDYISNEKMDRQFPDCIHQGVVALAGPIPQYGERDLAYLLSAVKQNPLILILDGVTDPHNLGAALRSADAAGVDFVMIPKDNSASITSVVSKVACGAAEAVPLVRVTNLARAMEILKKAGVWIYGADERGEVLLYQLDFKGAIALVLGAEGKGLRQLTKAQCDGLFSLPMQGTVASLNVSVATGISLYEAVRQRLSNS